MTIQLHFINLLFYHCINNQKAFASELRQCPPALSDWVPFLQRVMVPIHHCRLSLEHLPRHHTYFKFGRFSTQTIQFNLSNSQIIIIEFQQLGFGEWFQISYYLSMPFWWFLRLIQFFGYMAFCFFIELLKMMRFWTQF